LSVKEGKECKEKICVRVYPFYLSTT